MNYDSPTYGRRYSFDDDPLDARRMSLGLPLYPDSTIPLRERKRMRAPSDFQDTLAQQPDTARARIGSFNYECSPPMDFALNDAFRSSMAGEYIFGSNAPMFGSPFADTNSYQQSPNAHLSPWNQQYNTFAAPMPDLLSLPPPAYSPLSGPSGSPYAASSGGVSSPLSAAAECAVPGAGAPIASLEEAQQLGLNLELPLPPVRSLPLGQEGRAALKATISASLRGRQDLRPVCNSIALMKSATVVQLLQMAMVCNIWDEAERISVRFQQDKAARKETRTRERMEQAHRMHQAQLHQQEWSRAETIQMSQTSPLAFYEAAPEAVVECPVGPAAPIIEQPGDRSPSEHSGSPSGPRTEPVPFSYAPRLPPADSGPVSDAQHKAMLHAVANATQQMMMRQHFHPALPGVHTKIPVEGLPLAPAAASFLTSPTPGF